MQTLLTKLIPTESPRLKMIDVSIIYRVISVYDIYDVPNVKFPPTFSLHETKHHFDILGERIITRSQRIEYRIHLNLELESCFFGRKEFFERRLYRPSLAALARFRSSTNIRPNVQLYGTNFTRVHLARTRPDKLSFARRGS